MQLGLKIFGSANSLGFPRCDMNVWITEKDKEKFYEGIVESNGPQYIKVECREVLCTFVMYAKLSTINSRVELGDGFLWVPKELLHKTWLIEKKTQVNLSLVDISKIAFAESVIVNLNPQDVVNWSEDEVKTAENFFKTQNRITFNSQMVFVKPGTKK